MIVRVGRRWVGVLLPLVVAGAVAGSVAIVNPTPSSPAELEYSAYGPIGFHPPDTPIIKG